MQITINSVLNLPTWRYRWRAPKSSSGHVIQKGSLCVMHKLELFRFLREGRKGVLIICVNKIPAIRVIEQEKNYFSRNKIRMTYGLLCVVK